MEVTISPSSSCYFAGEELKCTITFTNTSTASAAATRPHRRGHSISSAPLARPPTSPGIFAKKYAPSSPAAATAGVAGTKNDGTNGSSSASPFRKGLVGSKSAPEHLARARIKRLATSKSLSISLSRSEVAQIVKDLSPAERRTTSAEKPFPANHPHARKVSVQWGTSTSVIDSGPPTASASPFPLPLDSISEATSPNPQTPAFPSPSVDSASFEPVAPHAVHEQPTSIVNPIPRRGLGIEFPSRTSEARGPRSASAGTLPIPGTETLLWAYAQVTGNLEIESTSVEPNALNDLKTRLKRSGPIGGGRMDLHEMTPGTAQQAEGIWSSLFGYSGRGNTGSATAPTTRSATPTGWMSSWLKSPATSRMSNQGNPDGSASGDSIWTFNPPQSMLAVDLTLMPGETKTYTYVIRLPPDLPPTFRGKALRFNYHLIVGTCRGRIAGIDSQSRLLRIPLRVYNHVSVIRPNINYDLLFPVGTRAKSDSESRVEEHQGAPVRLPGKPINSVPVSKQQVDQLRQFGRDLIQGRIRQHPDDLEDEAIHSNGDDCRLAVEVLTRQAKKAVYEVHRGGVPVASLVLPKTTFRLGETVHGIVSLNCFEKGFEVLKVTVLLETQELIPEPLSKEARSSGLRRIQAEQHGDIVINLSRAHFSLDIPSDASPGFGVTVGGKGHGGLQWRVRICFLVGDGDSMLDPIGVDGEWGTSEAAGDGERLGRLETVECEVPIVVLPAHTVFGSIPVSFPV